MGSKKSNLSPGAFSALKYERIDKKHSRGHLHGCGVYKSLRKQFIRSDRYAAKRSLRNHE